jgi:2-polyprenyl-6-methoxyphenol hydroxylase-like FAD-dependent oxidoreductase
VTFDSGPAPISEYTAQRVTGRLRVATGVADLQPRIVRTASFSFAAQLADRFRVASTFVVGDAAHRVTPRGGTDITPPSRAPTT